MQTRKHVWLAALLLGAPAWSLASAQQSTSLPAIRLVADVQTASEISNMYICSGPAWISCSSKVAEKTSDGLYAYPEDDNLGGRQVHRNEMNDLGGSEEFTLFIHYSDGFGGMPYWTGYQVKVETGVPVPIIAPFAGTLQASGALAALNGARVTAGEQLLAVVLPVPPVVDFDLGRIDFPQPGAPGVSITVTKMSSRCQRGFPGCR